MGRALVLNASHQPLCVVPVRRALVLALKGKAEVLHSNGHLFRSESLEIAAPSVVRLHYFVKVPYRARASLSRRAVLVRDNFECQCCGRPAENVDHVIPKSRGGGHTWDNVVAACRRCNHAKADRTLAELGWRLRTIPQTPRGASWHLLSQGITDVTWQEWLDPAEAVSA